MTLEVGQAYMPSMSVTDANGNPANPSAASLAVTLPDQTTASLTIPLPPAQTGLLLPSAPFVPAQAGLHKFAWATTGPTLVRTDYESFRNYVSAVSLDAARTRLSLKGTSRDEQVRTLAAAATREVEKVVGTMVPRVFTNDWIPGTYKDVIRVSHPPILNSTAVTLVKSAYPQGPSWTAPQLVVGPEAGTIRQVGLIPFWYGPWLATYTGGRAELAEPLVEGVLETLFDLWATQRGLTADLAEQAALEGLAVPPFYKLPSRALAAIKGYEQPGFG